MDVAVFGVVVLIAAGSSLFKPAKFAKAGV